MLLKSQDIIGKIRYNLAIIFAYTKFSNQISLLDINRSLEDFFAGLFNILYGCNYENLNTYDDINYPGVDLGDKTLKHCIQVTSTKSRKKIENTISKFENNKLYEHYNHLRVFIIDMGKCRYDKDFKTNGKYRFDKGKDVFTINDLFKEIVSNKDKIDEIKKYIDDKIIPVKEKLDDKTVELILFKNLFITITSCAKELISRNLVTERLNKDDNVSSSDLEIKKKRFSKYWDFIKENYSKIIDTNREKMYEKVQSSFSEDDLIRLGEYLDFESRKYLLKNNGDPISAIDLLTSDMIKKFNLEFVSEIEIKYFLYYQLYNCLVFPNE